MQELGTQDRRPGDITRFTDVDLTPDARFFVDFMDVANAQADVARLKPIVAEKLRLTPGAYVLDVGSGTGDDARALAERVGPTGRVFGVDVSQTMVDVARERSRGDALPVEFGVGDACALGFPAGTFDACRCERVLMHTEGTPAAAIAEMVRVTRPGGRVVVSDFHWDAIAIDHPDRARTRTIVHEACDGIRHGWVGSQLPRLMADAGLVDIEVEGHAVGITYPVFRHVFDGALATAREEGRLSSTEIEEWWAPVESAHAGGRLLASIMAFTVAGTVPGE